MTLPRRHVLAAAGGLPAWPLAAAAQGGAAPGPRKVLRMAFPAAESDLDGPQTNSSLYSNQILAQIFEAPIGYDYLARPARLITRTAAALPEISADGRVFTLRIRAGIFFQDDPAFKGKPRELTAADYVYGMKRYYDPQYNSSDLYIFESLKLPGLSELRQQAIKNRTPFDYDTVVEGIRQIDRYTFRVTLGETNPRFIYILCDGVQCGAVAREVVEFYGKEIGAHPVGTGPFRLKSWRRASRIVLERSPNYRREVYAGQPAPDARATEIAAALAGQTLPRVDEIQIDIVEEDQPRWLSFLNGDYAFIALPAPYAPIAAPNGQLAPFLQKRGIRMNRSLLCDMTMSFFYMEDPIVGGYAPHQVALRRAIGLAFDNDTYLKRVLGGMAIPAQSVVAPHTSGFDAAYKSEMSDYSPARARALLDLHGYLDRNGDGWRELPDGKPFTLRLSTMATQRDRLSNELWKRNMDAVGLKMEFDISTWPELLKKTRAGTLQMWGYGWQGGSPDGGFFLSIAYGPNASESNDPRFKLDAFDRLFEQQRALPDGPEREAVMRRAKDMLVAYMPYKVHSHRIAVDLSHPWLLNHWRHPFMRDQWRFYDLAPRESLA